MNNTKKQPVKTTASASTAKKEPELSYDFAFGITNYILLAVGIVLLIIGYLLLSGGGSDDPNVFNEAMFNSRRMVVAPLLIVAGLVVEICAIMFRPKSKKEE